jgi:predicted NAD/FAD-binding protein
MPGITNPATRKIDRREAVAGSSTSRLTMRIRPVIEILSVIAVTGLLLEVAKASMWALVAAGIVAAVWLLGRSHS